MNENGLWPMGKLDFKRSILNPYIIESDTDWLGTSVFHVENMRQLLKKLNE